MRLIEPQPFIIKDLIWLTAWVTSALCGVLSCTSIEQSMSSWLGPQIAPDDPQITPRQMASHVGVQGWQTNPTWVPALESWRSAALTTLAW